MPALKQTKSRIEILTTADALQPQPPIDWIVENLISAGSVNIFYGEGGSKKTWSLLDMAVCVATGAQWLDFKTTQNNVLIIDEESGKRRILRRLGDVLRGHDADQTTPIYTISLAGFDLGQAAYIGELTNNINVSGAKLVIIDALADVMPGKDENLVKDVQPIFLALRKIAEDTQAAIILIHHANKGKKDYRGSTAIKGAIDLLLQIESEPDKDLINFETIKARDTEPMKFSACAQFMMALDPKMFWLIPAATPKKIKTYSTGQEYVLRFLLKQGRSKIDDILGSADICSAETARKAVYALAKVPLIERVDGGGRGVTAEYELNPEGLTEAAKL